MASTLFYEQGWASDVSERQLAHVERNELKAPIIMLHTSQTGGV